MGRTLDSDASARDYDVFGAAYNVQREPGFLIEPRRGFNNTRLQKTETGTGAALTRTGGEYQLDTGTATSNVVQFTSRQRGRYVAGATSEFGVALRIPSDPTGTQDIKWGYFDDTNGIGFGMDATSLYVFRRDSGSDNTTRQSNWNIDPLDGSGPTGINLDVSNGHTYEGQFVYYGQGNIQWQVLVKDSSTGDIRRVVVHQEAVDGGLLFEDPALPLRVRAENGASTSTNLQFFVGLCQYSRWGGNGRPNKRTHTESLDDYTVDASEDAWRALITVRPKSTFPGSENNSVNIMIKEVELTSDQPVEVRGTLGGNVTAGDGVSFSDPSNVSSSESAAETATQVSGDTLTEGASTFDSIPIRFFAEGSNRSSATIGDIDRIPLGGTREFTLSAKKSTAQDAVISCVVRWEEDW